MMTSLQTSPSGVKVASGYTRASQPVIIRFFAHLFSFVFHPLFIPLYVAWYLAFMHPACFSGIAEREKMWVLLRIAVNMVFFPLVSVLLLKGVGFVDSVFLRTQRERIVPYIISNIFFFWMYLVFRNQEMIPPVLTSFVFSVFLSSSAAVLGNTYFKISMHAIGAGGLIGILLVTSFTDPLSPATLPLALSFLITGVVCTSRMIVSDHSQKDIYAGLLCGVICQVTGAAFIL